MTKIRTRRIGPGQYMVTDGERTVDVYREEMYEAKYGQWMARATWDRYLYTDPMMTKREAVFNARLMLEDAARAERARRGAEAAAEFEGPVERDPNEARETPPFDRDFEESAR